MNGPKTAKKILIVEDEALTAMMLSAELRARGYAVCRAAASGEKALAVAAEESPDLILMDVRLTGPLNGIETARRILARGTVPIVFMTGYCGDEILDKVKGLKTAGVLSKPIQICDIEALLESLFPESGAPIE